MEGIILLALLVIGLLAALLWTPISAYVRMQRAGSEDAKKPHRARLRQWFRWGGAILIIMAVFSQASVSSLPGTGLPLSSYDMAAAALGVAMLGVSWITFRDPEA